MTSQVLENGIEKTLEDIYRLSLLSSGTGEDEVADIFSESIDDQMEIWATAILDEEDRPYQFVFFHSPCRDGLMLAVIDRSDPENQEIRFHDNAFWWWFFLIEVTWLLRDAIEP